MSPRRAPWDNIAGIPAIGAGVYLNASEDAHLETGSHWRGRPCTICRRPLGGALVTLLTMADLYHDPEFGGVLHSASTLIHATCAAAGDAKIATKMHAAECLACRIRQGT